MELSFCYDVASGEITDYNKVWANQRFVPASTFKFPISGNKRLELGKACLKARGIL